MSGLYDMTGLNDNRQTGWFTAFVKIQSKYYGAGELTYFCEHLKQVRESSLLLLQDVLDLRLLFLFLCGHVNSEVLQVPQRADDLT